MLREIAKSSILQSIFSLVNNLAYLPNHIITQEGNTTSNLLLLYDLAICFRLFTNENILWRMDEIIRMLGNLPQHPDT